MSRRVWVASKEHRGRAELDLVAISQGASRASKGVARGASDNELGEALRAIEG